MSQLSPDELRHLRNNVPINSLIQNTLHIPTKHREGFLRFLCPRCSNFNTATNPKTNLARCFTCQQNFNPIDLVMSVKECSFRNAVAFLKKLNSHHGV